MKIFYLESIDMYRIIPYLFFFFSFSCAIKGFAQNATIDSLKGLLPTAKGVDRVDLLRQLIAQYLNLDLNISLKYADEAVNSIPQIQDSFRIVRAYRNKGQVLYHLGRFHEIISSVEEGLAIARRNKINDEIIRILNMIGLVHVYTGEYSKALECFLEPLASCESCQGEDFDALYNSLGLVYYKLRNNEKALEYYKTSLQIQEKNKRLTNSKILYINIGLCYCELKDYPEALHHINRGLSMCTDKCDEVIMMGQFALGMTKFRMNDLTASEIHLDSSLLVSRNNHNTRFIAENLVYLARIYLETGRCYRAAQALKESEAIALQYDYRELLLDTYRVFIKVFEKQQHHKNSSEYYFRHSLLREKQYGQALLQNIAAFQVDLEHHENVKTISHQKQVMALQKDALTWEEKLYYGLSFIILLLAVIVVLVYRQVLHKREVNKLLEKRIRERSVKLQEKQRLLTHTQEELKQLIERFLKTISSRLIWLEAIAAQGLKDKDPSGYTKAAHDTIEQIKMLINSMRKSDAER